MEVLVEYEYLAVEEDELTIRRGDVISNVVRLSDGWMEGDLDGRRGAFPDNFVKEIKKEDKVKSKEAPKKPGGHVADLANKLDHQGIKVGPPPNGAAKVTKRDQSRRKLRAKVVFSYTPANDDELRLEAGDVVEVLKQEEEGWWEGTLNGKTGMFPSNFVEPEPGQDGAVDDKRQITNDKEKKKVPGIGLGNIFKDGPINLRPTGELKKPQLERTEPKPTLPTEEKTASLKRNTPMKQPPALPPKDVTENKKASPTLDKDEKFPISPEHRSHSASSSSSAHQLESIPEFEVTTYDKLKARDVLGGSSDVRNPPKRVSCVSEVLDSFVYSDDDQDCPHGTEFDHTSLDSEGCCDTPLPDDLSGLHSVSLESSMVTPSLDKDITSPMSDVKVNYYNVNVLDGRKSGASRVSSGSDIPLDMSEISQTRATPPPKITFRKRRAKNTPKTYLSVSQTESSTSEPRIDAGKPPRKRPRKFLSTTGVVWTTSTDPLDKGIIHRLQDLNTSAPEGVQFPGPERTQKYLDINGGVTNEAAKFTMWGYKDSRFTIRPKKEEVKKRSVSFACKDKFIEQDTESISSKDSEQETKLPLPHKLHVFKVIDAKKITDSVELNKEKMRSGKWIRSVEAKNKEIQTVEDFSASPVLVKGRRSVGRSLGERISSALSLSPRSNEYYTLNKEDTSNIKPEQNKSPSKTNTIHFVSPDHDSTKRGPAALIDIVSATSKPIPDNLTEYQTNFGVQSPVQSPGTQSNKITEGKSVKKGPSFRSPFFRFRQSKVKVSPIDVHEGISSPLKQDIMDGKTYVRMSEPTYFESLKEMGRLSPSVRQLSQRYSLFQDGSVSRSLDQLDTSQVKDGVDNINDRTSSLPQLSESKAVSTTEPRTCSSDDDIQPVSPEIKKNKEKRNKRRFSLFSGLGSRSRRASVTHQTPEDTSYMLGDSGKGPETETKENGTLKDEKKRKRFSLLRSRKSGDLDTMVSLEDVDSSKKERTSLFGSLRRRFSMKRGSKQDVLVQQQSGLEIPVMSSSNEPYLQILTDDQQIIPSTSEDGKYQSESSQRSEVNSNINDLWKVESSPRHGEKWVALKCPAMAPKLPRRNVVKSDGHLPLSRVEDHGSDNSGDRLLQIEQVERVVAPKDDEEEIVDAFFGRLDGNIDHEEVVDLDDYFVVDDLNQFVDEKQLEDAAERVVQKAMWNAIGEVQRKKLNSPSNLNEMLWTQSSGGRTMGETQVSEQEIRKTAEAVAANILKDVSEESRLEDQQLVDDGKPSYFRMMRAGFRSLATEDHQAPEKDQEVENSSNNNSLLVRNNVTLTADGPISPQNDNCSNNIVLGSVFGKEPSPVSPEENKQFRKRMQEFVKYHEDFIQSGSAGAPLADRVQSQFTAEPEDSLKRRSEHAAFYHSADKVFFKRHLEGKQAGSMFYGDIHVMDDEMEITSVSPSPVKRDPSSRVAGSYFFVRSPSEVSTAKDAVSSSLTDKTSTPKLEKQCRRRSCGWWLNIEDDSEPSTFRPSWGSPRPEDRPIGVHFGTPPQIPHNDRSTYQPPVLPEERPVGVHTGLIYNDDEEKKTDEEKPDIKMLSGGANLSLSVISSQLNTANTSLLENSYYSLNNTVNFSSSSIVDQLP